MVKGKVIIVTIISSIEKAMLIMAEPVTDITEKVIFIIEWS